MLPAVDYFFLFLLFGCAVYFRIFYLPAVDVIYNENSVMTAMVSDLKKKWQRRGNGGNNFQIRLLVQHHLEFIFIQKKIKNEN